MNAVVAQFGSLLAVLAAFSYFVLRDLVREELRARVSRLPFAILWMAGRRLPLELRAEIYDEEWLPEPRSFQDRLRVVVAGDTC